MVSLLLLAVPQPLQAATSKLPLAIVAKDYRFHGLASSLPAGTYDTRYLNLGKEPHVIVALNLGPVCSTYADNQVISLIDEIKHADDPEAAFAVACPGGDVAGEAFAFPGGRDRQDFNFVPGRVYYFCPIPTEQGIPHDDLGMRGFVNVRSLPSVGR